jgi:gas vesicle protein
MVNDKSLLTVAGILTGLTAGIVIGIALAPMSGKDARHKIAGRVKWSLLSPREKYLYLWKRTCGV